MIRIAFGLGIALLTAMPAQAIGVAFTGTIMNDTPPSGPNPACAVGQIYISFSPATAIAVGTSNLGSFGPTQAHCLTPPPTVYSDGVFDFAFAAGDVLQGTYSGFFTPTATPGILNNTINFIATGGTGRFVGASGTIQAIGTLDLGVARPFNNVDLVGQLDLPAVPEPASWALLITGFGLVGSVARRRRQISSMKLSSTRFDPAFSNSISSLLPSMAVTAP